MNDYTSNAERPRKHQPCFGKSRKAKKFFVRPIIDWTGGEVWEYIKENNLPYCNLYDLGFHRIGCVLCPFSRDIKRDMYYFPKIVNNWRRACDRIMEKRIREGKPNKLGFNKLGFKNGTELFNWWVSRS